jgi:hypothetical protein
MRDIMKLLLGDGQEDSAEIWDRRGRRPRVADSREWCGTGTGSGDDAIGELAAALGRGRGGRVRVKRVVVKRPGPFGML